MAWEPIEKHRLPGNTVATGIAVSLRNDKYRPRCGTLVVRIGGDVMADLRWEAGMNLGLSRGLLQDDGLLRLKPTPDNGYALRPTMKGSRACHVIIPARWITDGTKHRITNVTYRRTEDGSVLLVLPSFAQAKQNGGKK